MRLDRSFSVDSTGHNAGDFNCCRSWLGVLYFLNTVETNIPAKESAPAPTNSEAVTWAKYCSEALSSAAASSLALSLTQTAVGNISLDHVLNAALLRSQGSNSPDAISPLSEHPLRVPHGSSQQEPPTADKPCPQAPRLHITALLCCTRS